MVINVIIVVVNFVLKRNVKLMGNVNVKVDMVKDVSMNAQRIV